MLVCIDYNFVVIRYGFQEVVLSCLRMVQNQERCEDGVTILVCVFAFFFFFSIFQINFSFFFAISLRLVVKAYH
jgi:hypothetical protein